MIAKFDIQIGDAGKANPKEPLLPGLPADAENNFLELMTQAFLPSVPGVSAGEKQPTPNSGLSQEKSKSKSDELNTEGDKVPIFVAQPIPLPQPQFSPAETESSSERNEISTAPRGQMVDERKALNTTAAPKTGFFRLGADLLSNPVRNLKSPDNNPPSRNNLDNENNQSVGVSDLHEPAKKPLSFYESLGFSGKIPRIPIVDAPVAQSTVDLPSALGKNPAALSDENEGGFVAKGEGALNVPLFSDELKSLSEKIPATSDKTESSPKRIQTWAGNDKPSFELTESQPDAVSKSLADKTESLSGKIQPTFDKPEPLSDQSDPSVKKIKLSFDEAQSRFSDARAIVANSRILHVTESATSLREELFPDETASSPDKIQPTIDLPKPVVEMAGSPSEAAKSLSDKTESSAKKIQSSFDGTKPSFESVNLPSGHEKLLPGRTTSLPDKAQPQGKSLPNETESAPTFQKTDLPSPRESLPDKVQLSSDRFPTIEKKDSAPQLISQSPFPIQPEKAVQVGEQAPVAAQPNDDQASSLVNGKEAAKQESSMRFAEEQNKFAENAVQKLPRLGRRVEASVGAAGSVDAKLAFAQTDKKEKSSLELPHLNSLAVWEPVGSGKHSVIDAAQMSDRAPNQVDRLARLVMPEVFTFKQTAADTVTVSLKLDAQTEISLGLTRHDGHIQASIQCERGELSDMENHWGQLQESLARHNVQLLPLQQNNQQRIPVSTFVSDNSPDFGQPHQRQNREQSTFSSEPLLSVPALGTGKFGQSKKAAARRGWESWA